MELLGNATKNLKRVVVYFPTITYVAAMLACITFMLDIFNRQEQRTVTAWQMIASSRCGNSATIHAIEYLNSRFLKSRTSLARIDLSNRCSDGIPIFLQQLEAPGAILEGANLTRTDLRRANLSGSNLNRANLSGAVLADSILEESTELRYANLEHTSLDRASLRKADLRNARMIGANLTDADLTDADMTGAELTSAVLDGANLSNTVLSGATLEESQLREAWAWEDAPPVGLTGESAGVLRICDSERRSAYVRKARFGVPVGCRP